MRVPLRISIGALLTAGVVVALSARGPVWGAEQQRGWLGRQAIQPRDPRPVPTVAPPRVRLSADRVQRLMDAAVRQIDYVPGEVVVRFRSLTTPSGRQRALSALRGRPGLGELEWHGPVALVRDATQPDAHVLAHQLMTQPEVAFAEPNYIFGLEPRLAERQVRVQADAVDAARPSAAPNDTFYGNYQWNFSILNMPGAWDIQPGADSSIVVAVVDSGVTAAPVSMTFRIWTGSVFENVVMPFGTNPDLSPSRLVDARDFAFLDPAGPVLDMDGHGTHVAGTIGEDTNNALLLAGLAYNARIMPVKVCTGYWEAMVALGLAGIPGFAPDASQCLSVDIADGIRYAADRGAKVINLSLGGPGGSTIVRDALSYAVGRGAFVAASMGNSYEDGNPTIYPAAFAADIMGVMSVAAVGKTQSRSYYSSTGAYCEIAAPGGDRRVGGSPDAGFVFQTTLDPDDMDPAIRRPRFDRYVGLGLQGTSMASPHVAGLAALIAAQSPGISPAEIELIIRATAQDKGAPGKDNEYGFGLIQPRAVLFGWGIRR